MYRARSNLSPLVRSLYTCSPGRLYAFSIGRFRVMSRVETSKKFEIKIFMFQIAITILKLPVDYIFHCRRFSS